MKLKKIIIIIKKSLLILIILFIVIILKVNGISLAAQPVQNTVEGNGFYFSTGESYPTNIQITGYNARDKKLYLNFDLSSTKTTITGLAKFTYTIEVFNNNSELLGNLGVSTPEYITSTVLPSNGVATAKATNKIISFTVGKDLTAEHRIVITVKDVVNTP